METRRIGSLEVSVIGLGCNNFGRRLDEDATRVVVDAALDAGINFFDTADIYGGTKSEEFLGRILKGRRDQVVLATKFGHALDDDRKGASPSYVHRACEDSLRRLQTDVIDLYQVHTPDPTVPIADTLGALDELVKAGKVREVGCSNFTSALLNEGAAAPAETRFVSVQNWYSLLKREPEESVLGTCAELGMAFIPYFPLESGMLTGKYRRDAGHPEGTRIAADSEYLTDENFAKIAALTAFAEGENHSILELAFAYLLDSPVVASVIAGATKPEQIHANAAVDWRFTDDQRTRLRALLATI